MKRKLKKEIVPAVGTFCDGPDHIKFIPCNVLWEESEGFGSFGLQQPLNAKSLMDLCGNLEGNTESKPISSVPLQVCFCFPPRYLL